jgi:predicted GNAT family acetyltransferase
VDTSNAKPDLQVQHEETPAGGAFFVARHGARLGELVYARKAPELVEIEHTEVDPSLRGEGVARKLLDAAVAWARETGTRVQASCPYARAQFQRDPSIRDVYVAR